MARIGIESDRVNEERRVWLTCADCPAEMFLGEQAEVRILTGTRGTALMVPEVAITGFDGFRGQVWTVQDGRLVLSDLRMGVEPDYNFRFQVAEWRDGRWQAMAPVQWLGALLVVGAVMLLGLRKR